VILPPSQGMKTLRQDGIAKVLTELPLENQSVTIRNSPGFDLFYFFAFLE